MASRRNFKRPSGSRNYKKLFIISTEGYKTEAQYFEIIKTEILPDKNPIIHIKCLKGKNKSSPKHVKKRLEEHIKYEELKKKDEAWLVIDRDQWTEEELNEIYQAAQQQKKTNYHIALTNPKFELWLLLHLEDAKKIKKAQDCSDRLKNHWPRYNKSIPKAKISIPMIKKAIKRAKEKDNPPCKSWPDKMGVTTVYRLVEKLIKESDE